MYNTFVANVITHGRELGLKVMVKVKLCSDITRIRYIHYICFVVT